MTHLRRIFKASYTSLYTLTKHSMRGEIRMRCARDTSEMRQRCVRDVSGDTTWKDSVEDGAKMGVGGKNVRRDPLRTVHDSPGRPSCSGKSTGCNRVIVFPMVRSHESCRDGGRWGGEMGRWGGRWREGREGGERTNHGTNSHESGSIRMNHGAFSWGEFHSVTA